LANQCSTLFQSEIHSWSDAYRPLVGMKLSKFEHLMQRVDLKKVEQMIEESKDTQAAASAAAPAPGTNPTAGTNPAPADNVVAAVSVDSAEPLTLEPLAPTCTIEDFMKVDLRVARVIKAEEVPEAKKLIKLTVSLGGDVTRTVFAGIKAAYTPAQLEGRLVVIVANLQPRQMKFGLSEGMVTAAGAGGVEVFLLSADSGAKPGHRVH
jgi:methionyl-tRNA synthetase